MFAPMASYLSAQLGVPVRLSTEKNFKLFWSKVQGREYDLVHFNQYHYVVANQQFGYQTILQNEEKGKSTISGAITVRKDSGIHSIQDLKGKTILFGGGPRAMQSYIAARWLLEQEGLTKKDYITKFAVNPPNAVISTYNKQADAAGIGDVVLELDIVKQSIDISEMKHLVKSTPTAHLSWAVSPLLSPEISSKIQNILTQLVTSHSGQKILQRAELTALLPAVDEDYDDVRKIISDVYGETFAPDLPK